MPFIIIGLCVGMYFMYISPTIADIQIKREKKSEYTNVLEKVRELKEQRDSLSTTYNSIPIADLEMLNKIIPTKFDPVYFSNDINAMSSKYGMAIREVRIEYPPSAGIIDAQVGEKNYKTIKVQMVLGGRYEQFLSFLKDLETSLRLIDVVDLNVTAGGYTRGQDINLDYTLEVQTYSLQ